MKISGAVALVTGGASGLGAATVRRLAQGGAKVVIADRDEAKGQALAAEVGATFAKVDVTKASEIEAAPPRGCASSCSARASAGRRARSTRPARRTSSSCSSR